MYRDIATTLYKRGEASMDGYQMPGWAWGIFALNTIIFVPIFLVVTYTFQHIYPTLAIVEDPSPPAYDPVSLNEDGQSIAEDGFPTTDAAAVSAAPAITSSLRSTHRAVYSIAGWRSLFRGYASYLFLVVSMGLVAGIFVGIGVPSLVAAPLIAVTVAQPYAAWTHIVISTPSSKYFWQRLPPFKRAFQATALPIVLNVFAAELATFVPSLLARVLKMNAWDPSEPSKLPQYNGDDAWKGVVVLLAALAVQVLLVIPTQVVLTRVQASFLPEENDTIVPFDRSFGGKVEPAIVGGKGYINMIDAWKSFSRASWIRLVKLYVKIFFIVVAVSFAWIAILIPEYILIANNSRKVDEL
ncbi:putative ubiquitin carrier protein [Rosellinia necatrix]|uniref:Putative ubiquitin carrier protein n=1 Tax=Rosellinia necatrix TaxID=77044 RepID=A0A1S7UIA3_ROSNE|nr:putative ubiquitin carrier protein [Rosellinia necatrix]